MDRENDWAREVKYLGMMMNERLRLRNERDDKRGEGWRTPTESSDW